MSKFLYFLFACLMALSYLTFKFLQHPVLKIRLPDMRRVVKRRFLLQAVVSDKRTESVGPTKLATVTTSSQHIMCGPGSAPPFNPVCDHYMVTPDSMC